MGRALVGPPWTLMGQALVGALRLLWARPLWAPLGLHGLGPNGLTLGTPSAPQDTLRPMGTTCTSTSDTVLCISYVVMC